MAAYGAAWNVSIASLASFDKISGGILTLTVVPEPHEYAIMVTGMLGLLIVIRRLRRNSTTA